MTKRLLLVLAAPLALPGIKYVGGTAILLYALTTADPFPPFMADYHPNGSYAHAGSSFDQFVTHRFPIGSNAQDAIAKIGLERFCIVASKAGLYQFTWNRHAGPCGEHYSIILEENSDGTIAEISGRLRERCL